MRVIRLALAQINLTVGSFERNAARVRDCLTQAERAGADLVLFPELTLCGYPPEDLLLKSDFLEANRRALEDLAPAAKRVTAVVGFAHREDDVYNAAAVLHDGEVAGIYHKHYLPNYAVFDEKRYFQSGKEPMIFRIHGVPIGVTICEDMWYPDGPHAYEAAHGAEILLCSSASPYHRGKTRERERMLATRAGDSVAAVAFCNLVGGQDELIFDGGSVVLDERGRVRVRAPAFEEEILYCDIDADAVFRRRLHDPRRRAGTAIQPDPGGVFAPVRTISLTPDVPRPSVNDSLTPSVAHELEALPEVRRALTLGLHDYVEKNGFETVVLGLSGGIDSALSATIATEALGAERVVGVALPSEISSPQSLEDARELTRRLGIRLLEIPIAPIVESYRRTLQPQFEGLREGVTEENLQARTRGNLLMGLSNKFGWLVLATGNKSEFSVGYCTLYGDMAGGFAVLKDVPKTLVYSLARHWNQTARESGKEPPIPDGTLTRPPTAELRPDQKDEDSLPPYSTLDPILAGYIEEDLSAADLRLRGFDPVTVARVLQLVDCNEYKRRQAPPGIRITSRAFGRDRRLPITNQYRPFGATPDRAKSESAGSAESAQSSPSRSQTRENLRTQP